MVWVIIAFLFGSFIGAVFGAAIVISNPDGIIGFSGDKPKLVFCIPIDKLSVRRHVILEVRDVKVLQTNLRNNNSDYNDD